MPWVVFTHTITENLTLLDPWITQTPKEIEEIITKYGKEGLTPSQIGIKLRDQHAIPLAKPIINKGITQVLDENNLKSDLPEDLANIVNKSVGLQKHLKKIIDP